VKGFILSELRDYAACSFPALEAEVRALRWDGGAAYPHDDLLALAARVAGAAGVPRAALLRAFGEHLFGRFAALYPVFFVEIDSAFGFLREINGYVHDEVQKLHPEAQFPRFECVARGPDVLEMTYRSSRPLADLADGLIRGCVAYFAEPIGVAREDLDMADGCAARFVLRRTAADT